MPPWPGSITISGLSLSPAGRSAARSAFASVAVVAVAVGWRRRGTSSRVVGTTSITSRAGWPSAGSVTKVLSIATGPVRSMTMRDLPARSGRSGRPRPARARRCRRSPAARSGPPAGRRRCGRDRRARRPPRRPARRGRRRSGRAVVADDARVEHHRRGAVTTAGGGGRRPRPPRGCREHGASSTARQAARKREPPGGGIGHRPRSGRRRLAEGASREAPVVEDGEPIG